MKKIGLLLIPIIFRSTNHFGYSLRHLRGPVAKQGELANASHLLRDNFSGHDGFGQCARLRKGNTEQQASPHGERLWKHSFGRQFGPAELFFANPNAVSGISAKLQVHKMEAVACSSNSMRSIGQVIWGGNYFNQGSGDPKDDVAALVIIEHDPTDPAGTMRYSALVLSPNAFYGFTPLGRIIVQEQLTATIRWDKAKQAFFFSVASDTLNASTTIYYAGTDSMQPSISAKLLAARAFVPNCTSSLTSADTDVLFSNVSVN